MNAKIKYLRKKTYRAKQNNIINQIHLNNLSIQIFDHPNMSAILVEIVVAYTDVS